MNGLIGARVVVVDDKLDEALPIIKAFSKLGVPVAFFDGKKSDLPKSNNKLRGVRLAILDMDLGFGGSDKNISSTLVQTFSRIISDNNGPYGLLVWTNHPNLREIVAHYIFEHATLPKPVFIIMLKKADFALGPPAADTPRQFSIKRLSEELHKELAENSPLECMQVWEGTCFGAATNVTNSIAELAGLPAATDLAQRTRAWRDETLKLLLVISKAKAEEHLTVDNVIPSIFLALNPLHSDRMDALVEELTDDLSGHATHIMAAQGGSAPERKGKVNTMLHLASDQLGTFNPGNLFVFGTRKRPKFMPTVSDVLANCVEGNAEQQAEIATHVRLCGLEVTPVCDHAQNKMGLSRIIAGFVVPWDHHKRVKNAQFLKKIGPLHFEDKELQAGAYLLCLNSRYLVGAEPVLVKKLHATARVRLQLLADVQSWASYQSARQGVMMLG